MKYRFPLGYLGLNFKLVAIYSQLCLLILGFIEDNIYIDIIFLPANWTRKQHARNSDFN